MDFRAKPFERYLEMAKMGIDLPAPFNNMGIFDPDNGDPNKVYVPHARGPIVIRPAMTKAFLILAKHFEVSKAVIMRNDILTSPDYIVEYSEQGDLEILFRYNKIDGMTGIVNAPFVGKSQWDLHSSTEKDATAMWLGIISAAMEESDKMSEIQDALSKLQTRLDMGDTLDAWGYMVQLQYMMYEVVTGANSTLPLSGLEWEPKQNAFILLDESALPTNLDTTVYYGEPTWIRGDNTQSKKAIDVFVPNDPKEVKKLHKKYMKRQDYTPWEKAMIPALNPKYAETEIDVDIVNTISRTWGKDQDMQVKNFAFFGPAGSGKSAAEEHLASLLQIPFSRQMCSSGDDETSLFGTIIPVVEGMKEKLTGEAKVIAETLEMSDGKIDLEKVAEAIGFPSPQICMFDKDAAFEMMGIADSGEPIMDQRRKALEDKIKAITQGNKGKEGVSYKYIPSPLVTGIENGHLVALEEPTNVFNQGIFSCLYDVLDRNSTGTIRTPIGTITRHPDFMCMLSSNTSYTGNRDLPGPLKSRFQFLAHFKEPDEETLAERVMKKIGAAEEFRNKVLQCVQAYKRGNERAKDIGQSADYEATPRALFCFTDAVIDGVHPVTAYKQYVLPHLANDEEDLRDIWEGVSDCPIFWQK